ncbi:MAG: GNAT family N-acetyltransferase [Planctomycetaceae bacterium]|nr:GNAT family N-acetyltransferase [Planctomycetaceae bacterium]
MDPARRRCLSKLPDVPRWVGARCLLLNEGTRLVENSTGDGFVVWSADDGLGAVIGTPDAELLAEAAREVPELLAFADNVERVRLLLPSFEAESASLFSAPISLPSAPPHPCRDVGWIDIASQGHVPEELREELGDAARQAVPIAAAFDGTRAVAFAYVAAETESLWDVSVDTVASHRRRGYATAAVLHLMRRMTAKGKSAVWGALESNLASAEMARRIGFVECDRLWVVSRSATDPREP